MQRFEACKRKFLVQPPSQKQKNQFNTFRMEDTADMTVYLIVFALLNAAISLLQLYRVPSSKGLLEVFQFLVQLLVRVAIWRVSTVRVSWMGYAYIIALIFQSAHIIFSVPVEFADASAEILAQQNNEIVLGKYRLLFNWACISSVLGAANIHYLNAQCAIFLLSCIVLFFVQGDLSDPMQVETLFKLPVMLYGLYMMWYIFQSRELKRYTSDQKLVKREQQMIGVFDSLSDGILIVNKPQEIMPAEQPQKKNLAFCNNKSVELFKLKSFGDHDPILQPKFYPVTTSKDGINYPKLESEVKLVSLNEIVQQSQQLANEPLEGLEQYAMLSDKQLIQPSSGNRNGDKDQDRILIVKRKDIIFDEKECQLISFTDISSFVWLKKKQETARLLMMLNTTVHHEMLAPLKVTDKVAEYLLTRQKNKVCKEMIEAIRVSNRMMQLNMQDLLDNRLIQKDGFQPFYQMGSIAFAIQEIVLLVNSNSTNKNLSIEYVKDTGTYQEVSFDINRFQQVLLNLLSNAVKHQHEGTIEIFSQVIKQEGSAYLEVIVKDQGTGMTLEELEHAFTPFHRDSSKNPFVQSNHLGLSICKKICNQLGGTITAKSILSRGTQVTFTMEVKIPKEEKKLNQKKFKKPDRPELQMIPEAQDSKQEISLLDDEGETNALTVEFRGLQFQHSEEGYEVHGDADQSLQQFIDYYTQMRNAGLINPLDKTSLMIYADDQLVARNFLCITVAQSCGLKDRFVTVSDGQQVIDLLKEQLLKLDLQNLDQFSKPIQPVKLLILDINMPYMDGLTALKETKKLYKAMNEQACKLNGLDPAEHNLLWRPMTIHLSQHKAELHMFIQDEERADFFLEKPLIQEELQAISKILQMI